MFLDDDTAALITYQVNPMAGRRFVDVAKLFNASKSIAGKHINLRSQQLDVYSKTSTLAKAVKSQTDRVTLTAQAAIVLAQRLNEDAPSYASAAASQASSSWNGNIPRKDTVQGQPPRTDIKDGLEQDHHYDKSGTNSAAEPPAKDELDVQQKKAERQPLPDGTIPTAGVTVEGDGKGQDTFSERPVPEPSKQPLAAQQNDGMEEEGLKPVESDASTIPIPSQPSVMSADKARKLQRRSEAQIPSSEEIIQPPPHSTEAEGLVEGHDRDVFYLRSKESHPEPSLLPRTKIPKSAEDKQESDDHVEDGQLNQDVYYSTPEPGQDALQKEQLPHETAIPEQDQVPEGINTDVFRTNRVSKMLRGDPYASKQQLDLKAASKTPHDHTKLASGHDQDTFNVRSTEQSKPATPDEPVHPIQETQATTEKDMHNLGSQLAKDAESIGAATSEVCLL